jgi:hypothetical protein
MGSGSRRREKSSRGRDACGEGFDKLSLSGLERHDFTVNRHCERSETIQGGVKLPWIVSLRSQ